MPTTRRHFLTAASATAIATTLPAKAQDQKAASSPKNKTWQNGQSPWPMCLDTASLAQNIPLDKKVEIVAASEFDAIEPWDKELEAYEKNGGDLKALGKKIKDLGIFVPSVIGLWGSLANSKEDFEKRLDEHRNRLRMINEIGATHVQVIPDFKHKDNFNKEAGAWCYRKISEIALKEYNLKTGIIFLNAVTNLQTIADATEVAMLSNWPDAKIIPDTYHNFHGGSPVNSLAMLNGDSIAIFQFADSPKGLERQDNWCDKHRVLPGDGVLPLVEQLKTLKKIGYTGCVSLELYNEEYRKRDPATFLKEAHSKTLAVIKKATS